MNKPKRALVFGIAGLDEILVAKDPIALGDKTPVQRLLRPGCFGTAVAVGLTDQGIQATLVTPVGEDKAANTVLTFLRTRNVALYSVRMPGKPTATTHILVGNGDRTILPTRGSASEAWSETSIPFCLAEQKGYDWLALGHLPGDKDGSISKRVIRTAHGAGIPVSWTPGSTQIRLKLEVFKGMLPMLRLLTLNLEEAVALGGLAPGTTPEDAAAALVSRAGKETIVVVTNGGKTPSACYSLKLQHPYLVPPVPVKIVDTTGAGDAFHAGLAAGLIKGMDLRAALEQARQVAAKVCTFWGGVSLHKGGNGLNGHPPRLAPAIRQILADPW
jgi:sugar/nucleoside kinase (ribokinase family)